MGEHYEGPALMRVLMTRVIRFFVAASMERGSEQYVRLATDPALATVSGMYFVKGKEKKEGSSPLSLDAAVQQHIDEVAEAWAAPFLRARAGERPPAIPANTGARDGS
jgi:hypothetical protein